MFQIFSPNMLKTYELCPRKFYLKYIKNIQMPVNDEIFEFGKNIHALASYYLRGENLDNMEHSLTAKEREVWNYLKQIKYFEYELINTEYNLSVKVGSNFFGGRLDALFKNNETYYILDYKTGSAPKGARYDFQTIIYILAVKEFFNTNNIVFTYIDLRNREEVVIKFSPELEEEYKNKLISTAEKINHEEIPARKQDCKCEYSLVCY